MFVFYVPLKEQENSFDFFSVALNEKTKDSIMRMRQVSADATDQ